MIEAIQRAVLYIKEVQEIGLFAVMADSRLFIAFVSSPLYFIMLPVIGLLFTILAIINGYTLARAANKNFDAWFGFLVSALGALCASISLYGAVAAAAYGLVFTAGPFFFLAGGVLGALHQGVMLGLNAYRAYESEKGSVQRMHYVQALLNNVFVLCLTGAVLGTVLFVMILPIAPVAGSACAISAMLLTGAGLLWRILPNNWKQSIKGHLGLAKPVSDNRIYLDVEFSRNGSSQYANSSHPRLFSSIDYSARVKAAQSPNKIEYYLQKIIAHKVEIFNKKPHPLSDKDLQKTTALSALSKAITEHRILKKAHISKECPQAFQSFWTQKGDVEAIFDAAEVYFDMCAIQEKKKMLAPSALLGRG